MHCCSKKIGELNAKLVTHRANLVGFNATHSKMSTELEGLQGQFNKYNAQMGTLTEELKKHNEKVEHVSSWFWVPFYGQYLAIDLLIDEISGKIDGVREAMTTCSTNLNTKKGQVNDLSTKLSGVQSDIDTAESAIDIATSAKGIAEAANKSYSKVFANSTTANDYYKTVKRETEFISDNPESIAFVTKKLKDPDFKKTLMQMAHDWDSF